VLSYVVQRLLFALVVMWVAATLTFVLVRLSPSDPAIVRLGGMASEEELARERERLGLSAPLPVQYARFLGDALRLDLGNSFMRGGSAMGHVAGRLPETLRLGATAMALILLASLPLGIAAARRAGRLGDRVITTGSLVGQSLPEFWVGIMLMLIFARQLNWLPSSGSASWQHLILPAVTLALPLLSVMVRLVRSGLIGVMHEEYIELARAKGLSERVVLWQHAVRNMLIPVVTVGGLQLGYLLGGTVIVETVFGWPGVGDLLISSISFRDFPVIQACIIVITGIVVLVNLAVDLTYGYLDPRIRMGAQG